MILRPGDGTTWFNGRTLDDYFPRLTHRVKVLAPLKAARLEGTYDLRVRVHGGGPTGQAEAVPPRHRPRARRGRPGAPRRPEERGLPRARRPHRRAQEGRPAQGPQGAAVLQALASPHLHGAALLRHRRSPRVVGEDLTPQLVERLGRAATLWVGRRRASSSAATRAPRAASSSASFASGVASAGGHAVLAGVLPTPAVALLALDLGVVISASHNPPEYNGVKFFTAERQQALRRATRRRSRRSSTRRRRTRSTARSTTSRSPSTATSTTCSSASAPISSGLRIGVDCANGAYSGIAPRAFEELGAEVTAIGIDPDGDEHQRRLRRDRPARAPAARPRGAARPRRRVRRRRRPDARGRRERRAARRRPDPRDPRARPRASTRSR